MKYRGLISGLVFLLVGTAVASHNEWEGDREEVKERIKGRETHFCFEGLCHLFQPVTHPAVYPLFVEGFGVLFEHQEGRLSPKRENSHIACLYDGFRVIFERYDQPAESEEVAESQKIQLSSRFEIKGHEERFSTDFLNKLK